MILKKEDIKYFSYPNPQFRRDNYRILDSECDFFIYSNEDDSLLRKTKYFNATAIKIPRRRRKY